MLTIKSNRHLRLASVILLSFLASGCAANMAASGQNGPSLEVVKRERSRIDVERQLGLPVELIEQANGNYIAVYDVQAKTKPDMGRAAGHAALDLFTFGLWEFVGGPIEAQMGRRVKVAVEYDKKGNLVEFHSTKPNLL